MTHGSRIQAVIDLLIAIEIATHRPADGVTRSFFREHHYIGAKDRRAVANLAWAILRCRARLCWWVDNIFTGFNTFNCSKLFCIHVMRLYVFAYLLLVNRYTIEDIALLSHDRYGPAELSQKERNLLANMVGCALDHPAMPSWVRGEVPQWLEDQLRVRFGASLKYELAFLNSEAPLDLRINTLKVATREEIHALLAADGIKSSFTPFSPFGLRVANRIDVITRPLFHNGMVEVQDEGSQIAVLLAGAKPGYVVLDYCAGAGGKTLMLAACMANKGRLVACDVSLERMRRAVVRLRRANVRNTTCHLLDGDSNEWHNYARSMFDVVLVDVPCTCIGTWRRNPDSRWRISSEELARLVTLQADILTRVSWLLRPRGRLVYVTCSLLPAENEAQVEQFLARQRGFRLVPIAQVWAESTERQWPFSKAPFLYLTPAQHGTDGYFVAVLERRQ